jgi:alpha-beta hydrolase superfamily lysophospholipase
MLDCTTIISPRLIATKAVLRYYISMVQDETYFESYDGTKLFLYRWSADEQAERPRAVLHIVHGMAEYALRYRRLAEKLTAAGIEVWAADQRGHGKTADPKVNEKGRGGLLGHCADGRGYVRVTRDVHAINGEIKKTRPNVRLFLLGHSWGSFIVQNYIEEYSGNFKIDGCVLSGTKGPGDIMVKIGLPVMTLLAFFCGQRRGLSLARSMADGAYNKPFTPNRTPFDWISRDEQEVDKYVSDPLCGKLCSLGFYRDLAKILSGIHRTKAMSKISKSLPLYVFSGSADPVGDMGASPTALVNAYRNIGIGDLEFVLYPGARHETLNETNREEVMDNLLSWIKKHCE